MNDFIISGITLYNMLNILDGEINAIAVCRVAEC